MSLFRRTQYRIAPRSDEWTGPEETLVDAGSDFADLEAPVPENLFSAGSFIVVALSLVLAVSAGSLMVRQHERMASLSAANRTVTVAVPPPRGLILDRNGEHLVENLPSFDVLAVSRQIRRNDDGTFDAVGRLAPVLGIPPEELTLTIADNISRNAVFFLQADIDKDQALALTRDIPDGFYLITSTKRDYRDAEQFSTVIGYVGRVNKDDMAGDEYYLPSDTIGRAGVEASYEEALRGIHGQLSFQPDDQQRTQSAAGGSLVLNIDAQAQKQLFNSLFGILKEAGLGEAAAVVQNPADGSVLAMVSFPTYDNSVFTRQLSPDQFSQLFESPRRPLFNRVISGRYNPGSTIKPYIGMTALQEGVVTPQTTISDCNAISIPNPSDPSDPYVFNNWRAESGPFNLMRAIADSCNIYFFAAGGGHESIRGLGVERIVRYLQSGLADALTGIDLPGEQPGSVPSPEQKRITKKEPWYQGDTYNMSIGQGDLLVTPLWLNTYVSAIANGGTMWQPRLASRVLDESGNTAASFEPAAAGTLPFDASVIGQMRRAMEQTVKTGTAKLLQGLPVTAAAKTGTAEVIKGRRINSLLTVYAPAENPQIAMTILVEGSPSNEGYAIRAARQFLQWYFTRQRDGSAAAARTLAPSPSPAVPPASASLGI